jgi:hypothetical protein
MLKMNGSSFSLKPIESAGDCLILHWIKDEWLQGDYPESQVEEISGYEGQEEWARKLLAAESLNSMLSVAQAQCKTEVVGVIVEQESRDILRRVVKVYCAKP